MVTKQEASEFIFDSSWQNSDETPSQRIARLEKVDAILGKNLGFSVLARQNRIEKLVKQAASGQFDTKNIATQLASLLRSIETLPTAAHTFLEFGLRRGFSKNGTLSENAIIAANKILQEGGAMADTGQPLPEDTSDAAPPRKDAGQTPSPAEPTPEKKPSDSGALGWIAGIGILGLLAYGAMRRK